MKRLKPVELKAWALPLFALAISVPIVAAFALAGPGGGMAAGALVTAAILVTAARMRFDEEIEVAAPSPEGGGVLVVATASIEGAAAVKAIAAARGRGGSDSRVLVLAPALNSAVAHWLSDLGAARLAAQERLAVSLAVLATAGIDARGSVGDSDPLQATEDALRSFGAAEVVFVTSAEADERVVREVRRRLDRRVTHVAATDSEPAQRASGQPAGQ